MNITRRTAANIFLGCLMLLLIILHIRHLCTERGGFAVGGEWILYSLAIVGFLWRFTDDD